MSIQARLLEDMKKAMEGKEKERLSVVKMTRAAIKNAEIKRRKELDEDEVLDVLGQELKMRRDAILELESLHREEDVEKIEREIDILKEYLPEQLEEEELQSLVLATIDEMKATGREDIDPVMGAIMPRIKGQAQGQDVREMVLGFLND